MKTKLTIHTLAFTLALMLLLASVPFAVFADGVHPLFKTFVNSLSSTPTDTKDVKSNEIWDGSIASGFAGGAGTENDPYLIATGSQLACLAQLVNSGSIIGMNYYKLTADIYLNDISDWEEWEHGVVPANEWVPIGNDSREFNGYFDGDGHTVNGIYIYKRHEGDEGYNQGLFGVIRSATISNLGIANSCIFGSNIAGSIAGDTHGAYSVIINCFNSANISAQNGCVGGIVGRNFGSVINCSNSGEVWGPRQIGGIAGSSTGNIAGCYNNGTVYGGWYNIGGIAGESYGSGSITNCFNTGGFIVADNCTNNGGIAGYSSGNISKCYNLGAVTGNENVGGIVGENDYGNITDCYYLDASSYNADCFEGTALSNAQMQNAASYVGFDFTDVWTMDGNPNYPYAELIGMPYNGAFVIETPTPTATPSSTPTVTSSPTPIITPSPTQPPTPSPTPSTGPIVVPAGYNENDYLKLRAFLETEDENGVKNGEKLDWWDGNCTYDPDDPESWNGYDYYDMGNFQWIRVDGQLRVYWIDIQGDNMVGTLDLSGCSQLRDLLCNENRITDLNIDGCNLLINLSCSNTQLQSINWQCEAEDVEITLTSSGGGYIGTVYEWGEQVSGLNWTLYWYCIAEPMSGYSFVGWYDVFGNCVSTDIRYQFYSAIAEIMEIGACPPTGTQIGLTARFSSTGSEPAQSDGDIDGDGATSVADAIFAARYALGLIEFSDDQITHGDVDGSGTITVADAILIARIALGLMQP